MTQAPDDAAAAGPGWLTDSGGSAVAVRVFEAAQAALSDQAAELCRLDGVAGDGDHGLVMVRGARAALAAARAAGEAGADLPTTVRLAGQAWAADAGGTSGVLWGAGLVAFGQHLPADASPTPGDLAAATRAFLDRVVQLGRAGRGDKTMIDALAPFADALDRAVAMDQFGEAVRSGEAVRPGEAAQSGDTDKSGDAALAAWARAVPVAQAAAAATADLVAKVGRGRVLAERGRGTPDAGAVSMAVVIQAVASGFVAGAS